MAKPTILPMAKPTILIVENDVDLRDTVAGYLTLEGYETRQAGDGQAMWQVIDESVDLVLIDVNLPGTDGFALVRTLRSMSNVAIIMVSGRGDLIDRVVGLEIGADDYMQKPVQLRELSARIRAVLRRVGVATWQRPAQNVVTFSGWRLDLGRRVLLSPAGTEVALTTTEIAILKRLASPPGQTVSRQDISEAIRAREWSPLERSIDVHIANLRRKIEVDPKRPELIKSVHGIGYVLICDARA